MNSCPPAPRLSVKRGVFWATAALTFAVCGLPLCNLVRLSLSRPEFGVFDASVARAALNTLSLAAGTTVFALAMGTFLGFLLSRTDLPGKKRLKTVLLYPYIIPPFIVAIGWKILANPGVGLLKPFFPGVNIYTMTGLIFVEAMGWYTYVLLNVYNILEGLDASLEESARMCGAGSARTFFSVTLPLLIPTLMGSGMIVFLCAASSFGVPAILGRPGNIQVLTTKIYQLLINIESDNAVSEAMMLSLPVIFIAFAAIYLSERWIGRRSFATLTGKHGRRAPVRLRAWKYPVLVFLVAFALIAVGLPMLTIIGTSLTEYYGSTNLSLANYLEVFQRAETLRSLRNSFGLAAGGAIILAFAGFFIAYYKEKTRYRFRNLVTTFATLPYATPGTIFAMAVLFSLTGVESLWLLLIAYVAKYLSHGVKVMAPAIINVDKSLEEASLMCGASWQGALATVWFPILKGAFSTCIFLMIAPIFSELTMSVLLTSTDFPTVGTRLFHLQEYENPNHASVLAVSVLLLVLLMNSLAKRLSGGKLGV